MLSLVKNEPQPSKPSPLASESPWDSTEEHNFRYDDGDIQDASVQIYVNGVTLDNPASEYKLDASLNRFVQDFYGGNTPGTDRRRSWCPSLLESERLRHYHDRADGVNISRLVSIELRNYKKLRWFYFRQIYQGNYNDFEYKIDAPWSREVGLSFFVESCTELCRSCNFIIRTSSEGDMF